MKRYPPNLTFNTDAVVQKHFGGPPPNLSGCELTDVKFCNVNMRGTIVDKNTRLQNVQFIRCQYNEQDFANLSPQSQRPIFRNNIDCKDA